MSKDETPKRKRILNADDDFEKELDEVTKKEVLMRQAIKYELVNKRKKLASKPTTHAKKTPGEMAEINRKRQEIRKLRKQERPCQRPRGRRGREVNSGRRGICF